MPGNDEVYTELDLSNIYESAYCDLNNIKHTNINKTPTYQACINNEPVYFETEAEGPVYNDIIYNEIPVVPDVVYFETYPDT